MAIPGKFNDNVAWPQRVNDLVLGDVATQKTAHNWDGLQAALVGAGDPDYVAYWDDFIGDLLRDEWDTDIAASGTIAHAAGAGGIVTLTTDTTSGNHATLALGLQFDYTVSASLTDEVAMKLEVRATVNTALTNRSIEIGFSDAVSETSGLAFSDHTVAGVTAVANDAIVFALDSGGTAGQWILCSVNNGGTAAATAISTSYNPTAGTYQKFGVIVTKDGKAHCYIDDALVATVASAFNTAVPMTPWITITTLTTAAAAANVDYVGVWCVR